MSKRQIDFFFSSVSTYTYLAVNRAQAAADRHGIPLHWRPFSVRTLMKEQNNIPFIGKPVKLRYMWRDLERRAARHGIAFNGPPPYPVDPQELVNRVATVAAGQGWCAELARAAYAEWFLQGHDPGEPARMAALLRGLGRDAEQVLAQADSEAVRGRLVAETDAARELGIFGSPSFVCGSEVFWGDDRLEDAMDWCLSHAG
jgi:2-hydroxychromene-2-carboxylate isomerase